MAAAGPSEELKEEEGEKEEEESDQEGQPYIAAAFGSLDEADGPRAVYVLKQPRWPPECEVRRVAGPVDPIQMCSVGGDHTVLLTARGQVQCRGENGRGQLGVVGLHPRDGLHLIASLLDVHAVYADDKVTFARRSDGTMFSWGNPIRIGRGGPHDAPAAVEGLPPVTVFATRGTCSIAITADDRAYMWGIPEDMRRPVPLVTLCGRRVCRLALGYGLSAAETRQGQLLLWGKDMECGPQPVQLQPQDLCFPLRSLIGNQGCIYAADSAGAVWCIDPQCRPTAAGLLQRTVKLARADDCIAALTEEGELWLRRTSPSSGWRRVGAPRSTRPLGLVPYGGSSAAEFLLAPDYCCGKRRLALFARVAGRLGLPSDPLRVALVRFAVAELYITGEQHDPFGAPAHIIAATAEV
eukprot:TRINITY_DN2297_c0_g2_i16.p1 TRINITY_DN2297_c0_g2~~TRINITY_DN2297_c0_g2_i16.p1  ORF type:complete len:410 (+),score=80.27 TRINITY_DN2297_c0_g2_i16:96-1325(+)